VSLDPLLIGSIFYIFSNESDDDYSVQKVFYFIFLKKKSGHINIVVQLLCKNCVNNISQN